MKTVFKIVSLSLILILCFIIQIYVLNNLTFFGVTANIFLCFVVLISIFLKPSISIPFAFVAGILSDLIFTFSIGKFLVAYIVLVIVIIFSSKIYNKQNAGVIIIATILATFLTEIVFWIYNAVKYLTLQNIFSVLLVIIKGSILNVVLAMLISKVFRKIGEEE